MNDKCEWCELQEWRRIKRRRFIACYSLVVIMVLLYGLLFTLITLP